MEELSKLLNRTYGAIKHKVKEFNLKPRKEWRKWNKEEVNFLKNNYLKFSYTEIGDKLNKSRKAIMHKASELNLNKSTKISKSKILKEYFKRHTIHLKGKNLSEKTKKKLSITMKAYIKNLDPDSFKKRLKNIKNNPSNQQIYAFNYLKKRLDTEVLCNNWNILDSLMEVDIAIPELKFAIEWDGMYWHKGPESNKRDMKKNKLLIKKGWKFIRVNDSQLSKKEVEYRCENILKIIEKYKNSDDYRYTSGFYI